jgi:hypothetical protein
MSLTTTDASCSGQHVRRPSALSVVLIERAPQNVADMRMT